MKSGIKVLGAIAAGVAVGAAVGILLAPRSGKETRALIADKSGDMKDQLTSSLSSILDEVKQSCASLTSAAKSTSAAVSNGKTVNSI